MSDSKVLSVQGRGVAVRGDDIDTDRIIPARFLRCVTFEGLGEHAFEDDRKADPSHSFNQDKFHGASVLVANANFGCGSSREHAPQSLLRWGIQGLIGESFAEIFFGNCVALGVPCLVLSSEEVEKLQDAIEAEPQLEIELDVEKSEVRYGGNTVAAELASGVQRAFLTGSWDSTTLLLKDPEEIDEVAGKLPYVNW
ncbi:MAG: 3-isopropylmalate dehydratase small subunit [Planctomycetota bacterium]